MPNTRPEARRRRGTATGPLAGALAAVLLTSGLAGCSVLDEDDADAPVVTEAPRVVEGLQRALDRRAAAVRQGDRRRFARGLARRPELRREQLVWFDNLAQLPVARLRYRIDPATLVRDGDAYWVQVEQRLQLAEYDAVPVVRPDRFRFVEHPEGSARFVLASATDPAWEAQAGLPPSPWELGPVQVVEGDGVLGVFDAGSAWAASGLVDAVEHGLADVTAVVPLEWSRSVVLHAPSGSRLLDSLVASEQLVEGDGARVDAVAFPVWADLARQQVAATRVVLHPDVLDTGAAQLDRLVRHELVHVALGPADDGVPVWLSEGLAEYLSVRQVLPQDRAVSAAALQAARDGVHALPVDADFDGDRSEAHYGLAWWACEYLARNYGEPVLWWLLETLAAEDVDQEAMLRSRFGLDSAELARQAARLMVAVYDGPSGP